MVWILLFMSVKIGFSLYTHPAAKKNSGIWKESHIKRPPMWIIYAVILQTNICDTSNCSGFAGMSIYDIRVIFPYQFSNGFNCL